MDWLQDPNVMDANFVLRVEFSPIPFEIFVNGVPIAYGSGAEASPLLLHANALLIRGRNTVSLITHAAPLGSEATLPWRHEVHPDERRSPASVTVTVERQVGDQRASSEPAEVIARLVWRGTMRDEPQLTVGQFDVREEVPRWRWLDAEPVDPATAYFGVLREVQVQHQLLAERDLSAFLRRHEERLREAEAAFDREPGGFAAVIRSNLTRTAQTPWQLEPLLTEELDLRWLRENTLVQVCRRPRQPPLRFIRPDQPTSYGIQLILGRIEGTWRVLR